MTQHASIAKEYMHDPYRWIVADEAARLALTPVAADVNKWAKQQSDNTVWELSSADPVTWVPVNPVNTIAEKEKLAGIEAGATQNATDAQLRDRSTHTGTQASSTISDFSAAAAAAAPVQSVDGQTGSVDLSGSYEVKRKHNLSATTDPTANDDSTQGYEPLSKWINTATEEVWVCLSAATGAAKWDNSTITLDDLGSAAVADVGTGASQLPRNSDLPTASETAKGLVEKATPTEMDNGAADKFPDAAEVKRFVSESSGGGSGNPNLFLKSDGSQPAWTAPTATTVETASAITAVVDGLFVQVAAGSVVALPTLSPGTDYFIYLASDGSRQAVNADTAPPAGERLVGGFHCRAGDGEINPYSFWDLNWKPSAPNPRGKALSPDGRKWGSIYLVDHEYAIRGYSKPGVQIADDGNRPIIPAIYGGDGTTRYGSASWWSFNDVLASVGEHLPFYQDFTALAYGVVERQAVGTDPGTTQHQAGHRSKCGCEQITGVMWQWGADITGYGDGWKDLADGRGDIYATWIRSPLFGANWGVGSYAGSRASNWNNGPSTSGSSVGARGVSDHVNLQAER